MMILVDENKCVEQREDVSFSLTISMQFLLRAHTYPKISFVLVIQFEIYWVIQFDVLHIIIMCQTINDFFETDLQTDLALLFINV